MRTPAPATTNPRPAFDPVRPLDVPPAPAPRIAPAALRKVRGTYKRGNYMERAGLLGTFVADTRGVERVSFNVHTATVFVMVIRNRWESWSGEVTTAQWEALRAHLPESVEYVNLAGV